MEDFKTPLTMCKEYSIGLLSRIDLIEHLVNFDYAPMAKTDGYDWLTFDPPGSWSELSHAIEMGYIDEAIYEEVFDLRHQDYRDEQHD